MTLGVYFVILAQTALHGFLLWVGVTGVEIVTAVGPVVLGRGVLGCWACMRGGGEKEGGIRHGDGCVNGRMGVEEGVIFWRRSLRHRTNR